MKLEEDNGEIEFIVIKNDGLNFFIQLIIIWTYDKRSVNNMKRLIDLKNIFARQLPKMPKEYIIKLVFDRNHESLIILRNNSKVIGGICFRTYPT